MHGIHSSIDDVGDVLIAAGASITLGGPGTSVVLRGLGPGAEVELGLVESFKGGAVWHLTPKGAGPVALEHGTLIDLARATGSSSSAAMAARVLRPDPASASFALDLVGAATLEGEVRKLLLLAPGRGGRVRLSGRSGTHFGVQGLTHEIHLELEQGPSGGGSLRWSCEGGARLPGGEPAQELSVPLPLPGRVDLTFGAAPERRAPFTVALRPLAG